MSEQREQPALGAPQQGPAASGQVLSIDIERLTEKVYQLLRADVRLSQARGQMRTRRR